MISDTIAEQMNAPLTLVTSAGATPLAPVEEVANVADSTANHTRKSIVVQGIPSPDYHLTDSLRKRIEDARAAADAERVEDRGHWSDYPALCSVDWIAVDWHLSQAINARYSGMDESIVEEEDDRDVLLWLQRRIFFIATRDYSYDPRPVRKQIIPYALRKEVFERDAYRCQECNGWLALSVDHIVPESHGGPTTLENLQTLCRSCNSRKGNR